MPEAVRALSLVLRLRATAVRNQLGRLVLTAGSGQLDPARRGRVAPVGSAVGVGVALLVLGLSWLMSRVLVAVLFDYTVAIGAVPRAFPSRIPDSRAFVEAAALFVSWGMLATVALGLAWRDPQRLGPRVELLLRLPVGQGVALAAEVLERALFNPLLWVTVFPLLAHLMSVWGWGHGSLPLAALLTAGHSFTVAAVELGVAFLVIRRLSPSAASTVRGIAMAFGVLSPFAVQVFLVHFQLASERTVAVADAGTAPAVQAVGRLALLGPGGLGLVEAQGAVAVSWSAGLPALAAVLTCAGAIALLSRHSRRGLDAFLPAGERLGRRPFLGRLLSGAAADEVAGLLRDRPALVLHVLVPVVVVATNVWVTLEAEGSALGSAVAPLLLAGMITGSAALTLPRMGPSLWLLFTVPRPLGKLVLERARVWAVCGIVVGLASTWLVPLEPARALVAVVAILVGVPALAVSAAALSILAARPFDTGSVRRLRGEEAVNLLVLVAALSAVPVLDDGFQQARLLIFFVALSAALWDRARRRLPMVLDPGAGGTRALDAADGLVAVCAFLVLHTLLAVALRDGLLGIGRMAGGLSFWLAGLMALGLTIDPLLKQGQRLSDLLPLPREGALRHATAGAVLGVVSFALGLGYRAVVEHVLGDARGTAPVPQTLLDPVHSFLQFVVSAPLVEEALFRGLLFAGIRNTLGLRTAVWTSALLFAAIHHETAFGAVLVLGALAAWAFDRTRSLVAPIVLHAVHNGLGVWWITRL